MASLVWPDHCLVCRSFLEQPDERGVCRECLAPLRPRPDAVTCPRCGYPLATPLALCPPCRGTAFLFDRARSVGEYAGSLRELIHHFKFAGASRLAGPLAGLLADAARLDGDLPAGACVAAVPLHRRRRRQRGATRQIAGPRGGPPPGAAPPAAAAQGPGGAAVVAGAGGGLATPTSGAPSGPPPPPRRSADGDSGGRHLHHRRHAQRQPCRALTEAGVEAIRVLTLARVPLT